MPKSHETTGYSTHSLSPIRERVRGVWKEILSLIPVGILGWSGIQDPEERHDSILPRMTESGKTLSWDPLHSELEFLATKERASESSDPESL